MRQAHAVVTHAEGQLRARRQRHLEGALRLTGGNVTIERIGAQFTADGAELVCVDITHERLEGGSSSVDGESSHFGNSTNFHIPHLGISYVTHLVSFPSFSYDSDIISAHLQSNQFFSGDLARL